MSVREYVGARYVPVFADPVEWDDTRAYEPLTIVYYQGNSYTSRQAVPVGIPITNESFWALTGNYNAQIEQYREEVLTFDGRITNNADAISDNTEDIGELDTRVTANESAIETIKPLTTEIEIEAPVIDGSSTLITAGENSILIDCGTSAGGITLNSYLNRKGIEKLNALILTHMHFDHVDGMSAIVSHLDANTKIFIQMEPTTTNDEYNYYLEHLTAINNIITQNNLQHVIIPVNGSSYEFGDISCQFYNTNPTFKTTYDTCIANNTSTPYDISSYKSSLNNYSLISIIRCNDFVYIDTGDIEGEAQKLNCSNMVNANVAKIPHHDANWMGYFEFFTKINASNWFFTWFDNASRTGNTFFYMMYAWRLMNRGYLSNLYNNFDIPVTFKYKDATFISVEGNQTYKDKPYMNTQNDKGFYDLLPVQYYNANPYAIEFLTIKEIMNANIGYPERIVVLDPGSSNYKNSRLYKEIDKLNKPNVTQNYKMHCVLNGDIMTLRLNNFRTRYSELIIYNNGYTSPTDAQLADDSFAVKQGFRRINLPSTVFMKENLNIAVNTTWTTAGFDNEDIAAFSYASQLGVMIKDPDYPNDSIWIPCGRAYNAMISGAGTMSGTRVSSLHNIIYQVYFTNNKLDACFKIDLATNTKKNCTLIGMSVIW